METRSALLILFFNTQMIQTLVIVEHVECQSDFSVRPIHSLRLRNRDPGAVKEFQSTMHPKPYKRQKSALEQQFIRFLGIVK